MLLCRSCGNPLSHDDYMCDLGMHPLANQLVTDLTSSESTYPVRPLVCRKCLLVQLPAVNHIFSEAYPFYAGQSAAWHGHCEELVEDIQEHRPEAKTVLEIGSNDGTLLKELQAQGYTALGVEPCSRVAKHALRDGVATEIEFWTKEYAQSLVASGYQADVVVATNVLAHIPNLIDFLTGVSVLIRNLGTVVFEVPYIAYLLRDCQFDQIYAEHHCYFSLTSLVRALRAAELTVYDVCETPVHGGSLRVYAVNSNIPISVNRSVDDLLQRERKWGLLDPETYLTFRGRPAGVKASLLGKLTANTGSTWGYGASAKAITLMNYCGVDSSLIQAVVDNTPAKQGKYAPGCRVPIVAPIKMRERKPARVVNFLWNWPEESELNIRALCPEAHIINPFDGWAWKAAGVLTEMGLSR